MSMTATEQARVIKYLQTQEKRASTLKAKAKTYTEQHTANTIAYNAKLLRATLVQQGILK